MNFLMSVVEMSRAHISMIRTDPYSSQQIRNPYLNSGPHPAPKVAVSILLHEAKALLEIFDL